MIKPSMALDVERNPNIPDFGPGDTARVSVKVVEGTRERVQNFEGVVIRLNKPKQPDGSFSVRRIASHGVGVERTFAYTSPRVDRVEVTRRGDVRRARLYYLRALVGKAARIKEKRRPISESCRRGASFPGRTVVGAGCVRVPAPLPGPRFPNPPAFLRKALLAAQGYSRIAGVDEAGRGSWAGPLVAAAVCLPAPDERLLRRLAGVRDSKQLTPQARARLHRVVLECAVDVGVGIVSPADDRLSGTLPCR